MLRLDEIGRQPAVSSTSASGKRKRLRVRKRVGFHAWWVFMQTRRLGRRACADLGGVLRQTGINNTAVSLVLVIPGQAS